MLPLKRLLNNDGYQNLDQGLNQEQWHRSGSHTNLPLLTETNWDEVRGEILSTEFTDANDPQLLLDEGPNDALFYNLEDDVEDASVENAEESIELWAAQSMFLNLNQSPLSQGRSSGRLSLDLDMNNHNLTCYGMIYRTAVRIEGNMSEADDKLRRDFQSIGSDCYTFSVINSGKKVVLNFMDGTEFGVLNNHASKAIEDLLKQPSLQFEALASTQEILERISKATKAADAATRVNINIYGPSTSCQEVGRHLSSHKVYFQRPDNIREGSTYDNPHFLAFPDIQIPSFENKLDVGLTQGPKLDEADTFREAISNVYSSLTRGTNLEKVEGDRRLKAKLLAHQEQALCFMLQRENGPMPPEFRLWQAMDGDKEGWYQHAVTKAQKRTSSPETGGGILADEMGMGKSLSTLALITKTLDEAHDWAIQKKANREICTRHKACRATLIVVPSAILISEWLHEVFLHLDGTLKTLRYHGPKRKTLALEDSDIVLTTYHALVSELGDNSSPLHAIEWYRIVLDEAHMIRRKVTTFFRSVAELKARSRWCLSGTPIQNKLEDVGSLFAFIRAEPFTSIATFRRFVAIPFDEGGKRQELATRNLTLLLDSLCLRRSRDLLHLPMTNYIVRNIDFTAEEREQYEQTRGNMVRALREKVGEAYSKSKFGIFQMQLQLRIFCNHGTYQQPFSWARRGLLEQLDEEEDALCLFGENGEVRCSACRQSMPAVASNDLYRRYRGSCAHIVCADCVKIPINGACLDVNNACPLCVLSGVNGSVARPTAAMEEINEGYLRHEGYSSKIAVLISDVQKDLWQTKSIIFSCWTNTLNLVKRHLRQQNILFYRIDGDSSLVRRQEILDDFATSPNYRVLIMTTGTGAFGLNIMAANRVFIVEPQWNPSVENQAIARAIRINQNNSVLVTRYMVNGTVEQDIRSQQQKKLMIAEIGNNGCS